MWLFAFPPLNLYLYNSFWQNGGRPSTMQALVGQKKEANLYSADATVEGKIEVEIFCINLYRMYGRMAHSHTCHCQLPAAPCSHCTTSTVSVVRFGPKNWKIRVNSW